MVFGASREEGSEKIADVTPRAFVRASEKKGRWEKGAHSGKKIPPHYFAGNSFGGFFKITLILKRKKQSGFDRYFNKGN